ncbi:hypothetical protein KY285_005373 [Solanum tuberosum]|nr:hypothetical protein KY285_005373 [Solanum tuberosum]
MTIVVLAIARASVLEAPLPALQEASTGIVAFFAQTSHEIAAGGWPTPGADLQWFKWVHMNPLR